MRVFQISFNYLLLLETGINALKLLLIREILFKLQLTFFREYSPIFNQSYNHIGQKIFFSHTLFFFMFLETKEGILI